MRPGGDQHRAKRDSYSAQTELLVLHELWRLTGYRPEAVPPGSLYRAAMIERMEEDVDAGVHRLRWPIGPALDFYVDAERETCGVDPFDDA